MKKTILIVSTFLFFVSFSFGQTPQTQDKTKTATKTETKADVKKDTKAGCEKTCTMKKSSCCDKKGTDMKKEEKAPEKK